MKSTDVHDYGVNHFGVLVDGEAAKLEADLWRQFFWLLGAGAL